MIAEMRAERIELDVRRHFTPEKQPIQLTRDLVDDVTSDRRQVADRQVSTAKSATGFRLAAANNLVDVG